MIKKPELLMPAGDLEKAKISFQFGADACYGSTSAFSMRTREVGFTMATLRKAIEHAHKIGKKFYVPINIFPHENEMVTVKKHINKIVDLMPDAVIVADLGVLNIVNTEITKYSSSLSRSKNSSRLHSSNIEIHLSTQANAINSETIKVYKSLGVKRIILAREVSLKNINNIRKVVQKSIELEAFVHGAMCMSISGRCHLSNYMTGRDANRGQCTQVCRWGYSVKERKRPTENFDLEEDERYSYIFNAKDLCMIEHLDKLMSAGIMSFKVEGRNKSIYYCAVVARAYRKVIDMNHESGIKNHDIEELIKELSKVASRGYSTGFFFNKPNQKDTEYKTSRPTSDWQFVGIVKKKLNFQHRNSPQKGHGKILDCHSERSEEFQPNQLTNKSTNYYIIEGRNEIIKNSDVEILTPGKIYKKKLTDFVKPNGEKLEKINPGYEFVLESKHDLPNNSMLRTKHLNK